MTRVRISVDSGTLGDVDASEESLVGWGNHDQNRRMVAGLLAAAVGKINRAYELDVELVSADREAER